MEIHLSPEYACYLEAEMTKGGFRSVDAFIEYLLSEQRRRTKEWAERQAYMAVQEDTAAKVWDNDADAIYHRL